MSTESLFRVKQQSVCLPKYKNFAKVPVIKRDITAFPEDETKTKNTWVYENDFVAASEEDMIAANTAGI